jgi:LPS sulfotransferase NodH
MTAVTKFVLLTTQRSGSTFIRLWLNNHPSVRCYGEIFLRDYPAADGFKYYCEASRFKRLLYNISCKPYLSNPAGYFASKKLIRKFLNKLFYSPCFTAPWIDVNTWKTYRARENHNTERAVGFQLMYNQLRDYKYLKEWIHANNVSLLHLTRENILKLYLSRLVARGTGRYHSFQTEANNAPFQKIFVDPKTVLPQLRNIFKQRERMSGMFASNSILEFSYEAFFSNYAEVSRNIFSFLGLENAIVKFPSLTKVNPELINDMIENYDEICWVLKGTQFEQFLD